MTDDIDDMVATQLDEQKAAAMDRTIIGTSGGGLVGDATQYVAMVEQAGPTVKFERREKVVRSVPLGLSVLAVPHSVMRGGRRDRRVKQLHRTPHAAPDQKLEPINTSRKHGVGRNAPCPCGSGKKNKHCPCRG